MNDVHPPPELLLDYATGALALPVSLLVASHAALCLQCRHEIAAAEAVGGALLETMEPADVEPGALDAVMARLDDRADVGAPSPTPDARTDVAARNGGVASAGSVAADDGTVLPKPLRRYIGASLSSLPWRRVGSMFEEVKLPIEAAGFKTTLMRLKPGSVMPAHTHRGSEYTLVLAGGFRDNGQQFGPGDFAWRDASDTHRPVVDPDEACVCLVVLDAPLKLTGIMGHLINPFLRI